MNWERITRKRIKALGKTLRRRRAIRKQLRRDFRNLKEACQQLGAWRKI